MLLSAMLLSWLSGKVSYYRGDNDDNSKKAAELFVRYSLIMMVMKLTAVLSFNHFNLLYT